MTSKVGSGASQNISIRRTDFENPVRPRNTSVCCLKCYLCCERICAFIGQVLYHANRSPNLVYHHYVNHPPAELAREVNHNAQNAILSPSSDESSRSSEEEARVQSETSTIVTVMATTTIATRTRSLSESYSSTARNKDKNYIIPRPRSMHVPPGSIGSFGTISVITPKNQEESILHSASMSFHEISTTHTDVDSRRGIDRLEHGSTDKNGS